MTALSLFAGVGFGVACDRLGIPEVGVEADPDVRATRAAAGMITIATDVWHLAGPRTQLEYELLLAGPPCQTFSHVGKRNGRPFLPSLIQLARQLGNGATEALLRAEAQA